MASILDMDALVSGTKSKDQLWVDCVHFFDSVKGNFIDALFVERRITALDMTTRLLLFRGSESDVVQRLSAYDRRGKQHGKSWEE
jgi:hypothetical protein